MVYGVLQAMVLVIADLWWEMAGGPSVLLAARKEVAAAAGLAIMMANYLALLHRGRAESFERVFSGYTVLAQRVCLGLTFAAMAAVIGGLIVSFHVFGQWASAREPLAPQGTRSANPSGGQVVRHNSGRGPTFLV